MYQRCGFWKDLLVRATFCLVSKLRSNSVNSDKRSDEIPAVARSLLPIRLSVDLADAQ